MMRENPPRSSSSNYAATPPGTMGQFPRMIDPRSRPSSSVRDVWAYNFKEEVDSMMELVEEFQFVSVDTEYPGIVTRPVGSFKNSYDYHYQTLKCNVDLLKIIQVAFTFFDSKGNTPSSGPCTWQFNFKFSLKTDIFSHDAIALLEQSGIDFVKHESQGIGNREFAELFTVCGLPLNPEITWIAFHGGYDFAYLLRMLTAADDLPEDEAEFFLLLSYFFPHMLDIKHLVNSCDGISGSLSQISAQLGTQVSSEFRLAASDAQLTGKTFFQLREQHFEGHVDGEKFDGILFGLGDHAFSKNTARLRQ